MASPSKTSATIQILKAIKQLNPKETENESLNDFRIAVAGESENQLNQMKELFFGQTEYAAALLPADSYLSGYILPDDKDNPNLKTSDIVVAYPNIILNSSEYKGSVYTFDAEHPINTIKSIISNGTGNTLRLALGRRFPAIRTEIARIAAREISRENAIVSLTTALGNVAPSIIQPFLGVAEGVGDMIILTTNQVRMMFIIGSIYQQDLGFIEQWKELSSIISSAFGWRAIARELVSKIPFGGGIIPKGAIAYAGTAAIGEGLIFFYSTGNRMTKGEMTKIFKQTYSEASGIVKSLFDRLRSSNDGSAAGSLPGETGSDKGGLGSGVTDGNGSDLTS